MKFGTLLELNSNVEWWDYYVDYDSLKKLFPSVPLDPGYLATQQHAESGSLLPTHRAESAKWASPEEFRAALDRERNKVMQFYQTKFDELSQAYTLLEEEISGIEQRELHGDEDVIREENEDEDAEGDHDHDHDHDHEEGDDTEHDTLIRQHLRPPNRKRPSVISRLPRLLRKSSSVSNPDQADIFESTIPPPMRSSRSRSTQRYPGVIDEETSAVVGGFPSPVRSTRVISSSHRRAQSDLSSADETHDRRASISSQSSGFGSTWPRRRFHNVGLMPMDYSSFPDWLKHEYSGTSPADLESHAGAGFVRSPIFVWTGTGDYATVLRIGMKKRISAIWLDMYALKQYVDLNNTAFEKILKKYDKNTNSKLKKQYITEKVLTSFPWTIDAKAELDLLLSKILFLYRRVVVAGDEELAKDQLRAQLRERIVVDRETVWSQMVSDRRGQGIFRSVEQDENTAFERRKRGLRTPLGTIAVPEWFSKRGFIFVLAITALVAIMVTHPFDRVEETNCLALLVFCTILWATEAIPLFVTSLAVPFLVVVLRVLRSTDGEDTRLSAADATKYIFSQMFSPTIMLLIGGFTIAAALSRTRLDHMTASRILNAAGTSPSVVLLVLMFVATFASMWISNVAAPTLCYALVRPILEELHPKSVFSKCLIIAIALASNIGGQASPISSPQNLIALGSMDPPLDWIEWFAIALPVAITSILAIWAFLHVNYRWESDLQIPKMRKNTDQLTGKHYYVLTVTAITIGLWCIEKNVESFVGDMGIIAIIPLVAFFGTGILRKEDFHDFQWPIVFLAMGGVSLGKAVLSSGLLDDLNSVLERMVDGLGLFNILIVFSFLALIIATFISHTIAAVLLVPIATRIGESLDEPHPRLLIMATALICSAGMGLPVSGFPNMTAITQENKLGHRYINASDFLKNGIPASILATFVIVTIGYASMRALGL